MMRVLFAGTPAFAVEHLQGLIAHPDIDVVAVVTQPDRPGKRGKTLMASPVKRCALQENLTLLQPKRLQAKHLVGFSFDLLIVVAYGQILKPDVLALPRIAPINVHASLLPRWRGAAPVQRAILAGDQTTGVTIMKMAEGLDTGPIIRVQSCAIDASETSDTLFTKLACLGRETLLQAVETIAEDWFGCRATTGNRRDLCAQNFKSRRKNRLVYEQCTHLPTHQGVRSGPDRVYDARRNAVSMLRRCGCTTATQQRSTTASARHHP